MADRAPTILLVEDNDDHAELVVRALADHGFTDGVVRAKDGAQALDLLDGSGGSERLRPDVVFLDLRLPRVDGIEVLRRIKSQPELERVPVVVLTSSDADRDLVAAYDARVNAYVVKPVDYDTLDRMLRETSAFWLGWNRQP